jgi:uncharacterized protein YheU (UPF0270 family)
MEPDMYKQIALGVGILTVSLTLFAREALPNDVEKFIAQREGCDHMRGEIPDPTEKQRMKEVNREIRKLCKGTDQRLAQLKKKYAADQAVIHRLDEFEPVIEAPQNSQK